MLASHKLITVDQAVDVELQSCSIKIFSLKEYDLSTDLMNKFDIKMSYLSK